MSIALVVGVGLLGWALLGPRRQTLQNVTPYVPPLATPKQRAEALLAPLVQAMSQPRSPQDVTLEVIEDASINAANIGPGHYQVTTGLLNTASDAQLLGVLAHEVAHDDLHHVMKRTTVYEGLNTGIEILDLISHETTRYTPILGQLIGFAYTRSEEYDADAHGVAILRRANYDGKAIMIETMTWLMQNANTGGGFFSSHPATADRIDRLRVMA